MRRGEGLGRKVLGQVSAKTPGDERVNRREVLPERIPDPRDPSAHVAAIRAVPPVCLDRSVIILRWLMNLAAVSWQDAPGPRRGSPEPGRYRW
jgi:hypothetical protein